MTEAAHRAGISPRTIRRRLNNPAYRAEITRLRAKILDGILARLLHGAVTGVEALIEIAEAGQSESARVSASRILIEHSLSFTELIAVSDRLNTIEESIASVRRPVLVLEE